MAKIELTTTWVEVVPVGEEYLLQGHGSGKFLVLNAASQPTDLNGFILGPADSLSSAIYPATDGIWARAFSYDNTLIVDTWV